MRKILVSTALLTGASVFASGSKAFTGIRVKGEQFAGHNMEDFHWEINEITQWSDEDVESFWEFRQNGEECLALFKTIKANLLYYQELAVTIDGDVETYNTQCADLCLPGYLKCDESRPNTCVPECECCDLSGGVCCEGPNHSETEIDIGSQVH